MRYSRAVPVRINGPDWIEPEPAENEMAEASNVLAFRREGEMPVGAWIILRPDGRAPTPIAVAISARASKPAAHLDYFNNWVHQFHILPEHRELRLIQQLLH